MAYDSHALPGSDSDCAITHFSGHNNKHQAPNPFAHGDDSSPQPSSSDTAAESVRAPSTSVFNNP